MPLELALADQATGEELECDRMAVFFQAYIVLMRWAPSGPALNGNRRASRTGEDEAARRADATGHATSASEKAKKRDVFTPAPLNLVE